MTIWTYIALAVGVLVLLNVMFIVLLVIAAGRTERHPEESASEF